VKEDDEQKDTSSRHYTDIVLDVDTENVLALFMERVIHP
jgi:hypothetical protein